MRVLLIAGSAAGNRAERELRDMRGVQLEYARTDIPDFSLVQTARRHEARYVLSVDAGSRGAALKDSAREAGAEYVSIPSSWADAATVLKQCGFYAALRKEVTAAREAGGLTHRPLAGIAQKLEQTPQQQPAAEQPAPARETKEVDSAAAARAVRMAQSKQAAEAALKQLRDGLALEPATKACKIYRKNQEAAGRHAISWGTFFGLRHQVRDERQLPSDRSPMFGRHASRRGGTTPAERRKWATEHIWMLPKMPTQKELAAAVRKQFGTGISGRQAKRVISRELKRRDKPSHGTGSLPPAVEAAQKSLVDALRTSGVVGTYALTYAGGEAEASFELTAKGTTKL